jgi:hypothetical protein
MRRQEWCRTTSFKAWHDLLYLCVLIPLLRAAIAELLSIKLTPKSLRLMSCLTTKEEAFLGPSSPVYHALRGLFRTRSCVFEEWFAGGDSVMGAHKRTNFKARKHKR